MKMKRLLPIILVALLLVPVVGWATTYTVGSSGCDYTSIQAVFDNEDLEPDDIIEIRADTPGGSKTYVELITVGSNDSGDSSRHVTIKGRDGDTINIISGQTYDNSWTDLGDGRYSRPETKTVWILLEDEVILQIASDSTLSDGNYYYDGVSNTLYYKPTTGTPNNHTVIASYSVLASTPGGVNLNDASNITFDNIHFIKSSAGLVNYTSSGTFNITIKNCTFDQVLYGAYIASSSAGANQEHITIENCRFLYNGRAIGCGVRSGDNTKYLRYINNYIFKPGYVNDSTKWSTKVNYAGDEEGIALYRPVHVLVADNVINGGAYDGGIVLNTSGTPAETCSNIEIVRNKLENIEGTGVYCIDGTSQPTDTYIAYNLFHLCGLTHTANYAAFVSYNNSTGSNVYVANNTFDQGNKYSIYLRTGSSGFKFYNNISKTNTYHVRIYDSSIGTGTEFSNNDYYPDGTTKFRIGSTSYDFNGWKTATGQDSNSFVNDPILLPNHRLSAGSPCIDAGVKLPIHDSNWRDLAGNRIRYGTAPDIGCYEYKTWPTGAWGMLPWIGGRYKVQWTPYE